MTVLGGWAGKAVKAVTCEAGGSGQKNWNCRGPEVHRSPRAAIAVCRMGCWDNGEQSKNAETTQLVCSWSWSRILTLPLGLRTVFYSSNNS